MGQGTDPTPDSVRRNLAVIGAKWGDEGKGKIVDLLTPHFNIVARYQGGHNAGHTVWVGGQKYVLHLVPSGILHPDVTCVIGNGLVVDIQALFDELDMLRNLSIHVEGRLVISDRAHLILPYHRLGDEIAEAGRGNRKIGTTKRGIGQAYADKIARNGIRIGDLRDLSVGSRAVEQLRENVAAYNRLVGVDQLDWQGIVEELDVAWERLGPFVTDTGLYLHREMSAGSTVLFEGAQGTLLDVDHGTYPYVTSSNATVGGALTGLGVGPKSVRAVMGVAKAYSTRVGEGPMVTELFGFVGERLRAEGSEYGASTGRPRRCGWFDTVAGRYAVRVNGLDTLAITKLDVLDQLDELEICTAYRCRGELVTELPADAGMIDLCEPVYETMAGWKGQRTAGVKCFSNLPEQAKAYIERLEELCGCPVKMVTNGEDRDAYIIRDDVRIPDLEWMNRIQEKSP